MMTLDRRRLPYALLVAGLVFLLCIKYFWTTFVFDAPLGYDPGIYRYLFLRYADAFPRFPDLPPWGREHPAALFLLAAPFLRLGLSVDVLVGIAWNAVSFALPLLLGFVWYRREGNAVGALVLLTSLLSVALFHGFLGMYWKTFVSLACVIAAFALLEKRSYWSVPFGMLAIALHQQTGLLFALSVCSWLGIDCLRKRSVLPALPIMLTLFLGIAWYLPSWQDVVTSKIALLLTQRGDNVPSGSFQDLSFFIAHTGILLFFGVAGFIINLRKEKGTLWQWAVLWSLLFILLKLFFHRRFLLQLDFFLLPFAALAIRELWHLHPRMPLRTSIVFLITVQSVATLGNVAPKSFSWWCDMLPSICLQFPMERVEPEVTKQDLLTFEDAAGKISSGSMVLSLEPSSTPWMLGWMRNVTIAGPGIFLSPWDYGGWERLLLGSAEDRRSLLRTLHGSVYVYVTPLFRSFYGPNAASFLKDPCFARIDASDLYSITCTSPSL